MIGEKIMPEYRLCIVTEIIEKKESSKDTNWDITNEHEIIEHRALFHGWVKRVLTHYDFISLEKEKYIGNDEFLIAVVEYEDGTIHEHRPHEIQFTDGEVEKKFKNKKAGWNKITEDTDSYPESYENVLFRTNDGRIYYGYCDTECEWKIELENENIFRIKNVVEWRKVN